jgi:hypothetical protein
MKKFVLAIFMAVCASGMHAQTKDVDTVNINVEAPSEELSDSTGATDSKSSKKAKIEKKTSKDNLEEMASLLRQFNAIAMANQQEKTDYSKIYFPVEGKNKFMRRHHVVQQMALSLMGGGDNDSDEDDGSPVSNLSDEDYSDQQEKYDGKPNFGFSVDLSFLFIPGVIEGDNLRINKFGAGYSLGLVAAFDKQEHYGVSCDFLLKLGAETGYAHKMGIGMDLLFGTGKSGGMSYDVPDNLKDDDDIYAESYSSWCLKYGTQLWVRSSLLSSGINNTNVRLFIRYVYSKNPNPETERYEGGTTINNWMEESWQVGLQLCYEF